MSNSAPQRFEAALNALAERLRRDRSVLAMILCGSMAHDVVWERSDIDLVLVTIDDKNIGPGMIALTEESVNIHATLLTRSEFRKVAEGAVRASFRHSFLTKGRIVYAHDSSIEEIFVQMKALGERDLANELLRAGVGALPPYYKAMKWLKLRGDLHYAALWILHTASSLAKIEILSHGLLPDREVLPQAVKLNPGLFRAIYLDLFDKPKSKAQIEKALAAIGDYLRERRAALYQPVIDYLREAGEVRSSTEIETDFEKQRNVSYVTAACEYLADEGVITKASVPVKVTRKSNIEAEELAFVLLDG